MFATDVFANVQVLISTQFHWKLMGQSRHTTRVLRPIPSARQSTQYMTKNGHFTKSILLKYISRMLHTINYGMLQHIEGTECTLNSQFIVYVHNVFVKYLVNLLLASVLKGS